MNSMFDILCDIPLFRGVTRERIADTVGTTKFHFLKFADGDVIVSEGEQCTHLQIVLSGTVNISIANSDERFVVSQNLVAPDVISPDFLFGPMTLYPGTATAVGEVSMIRISKNDYVKILSSDNIFLYNYLNFLSTNAQKCVEGVLAMTNGDIEERLAMWIVAMTQPGATDISITCKQKDLNAMFGVARSSFIAALDRMRDKNLISYIPGKIYVNDRREILRLIRTSE